MTRREREGRKQPAQRTTPAITHALIVDVAKDRVLREKSWDAAVALQRAQQKHKEVTELKLV